MSIRHIAECFYTPSLKTNERMIAIALADYADDFGRCWPSLANIAAKTGYSRRQTSRIVQQLVVLGYVLIEKDATWTQAPLYRLHPEALEKPSSHKMGPEKQAGRQSVTTPEEATPEAPPGDKPSPEEATPTTATGDTGVTLNRKEPSSLEPSRTAAALFPAASAGEIVDTQRNEGWDALVTLFDYEPHSPAEESIWKEIADRANQLNDPANEVRIRALGLVVQWGAARLTPASLNKWWDRFGSPLGVATDAEVETLRDDHERLIRRQKADALEGASATKELEAETP